jgi:hypothetical protein
VFPSASPRLSNLIGRRVLKDGGGWRHDCLLGLVLLVVGCMPRVSRSEYFFVLVHLRCFDSVFSVTACLILYLDTVGFAYYRYVFVVRYSCLSKPLEKYFRSWQRRRLSYFFSSGADWEFCVSSDRGDAGGYFLFPVWWIWTLLARDGGFLLELICFIVQLMNFEIF